MGKEINKKLKTIIERRNATLVLGAFNAITAKQIDDAGFEAIYLTGAGITNAQFGLPDLGFINLNNLIDTVNAVREISDLPVIVDIDTGFGNEVNVYRTIRSLERAEANGIQIEDQEFPKKCGHFEKKRVIPIDEAINKILWCKDNDSYPDYTPNEIETISLPPWMTKKKDQQPSQEDCHQKLIHEYLVSSLKQLFCS